MGHVTVQDAAKFFVQFSATHGDLLTNLKLQKLLYYAQAWYLALYDRPLFDAEFQAWVHGPVQPGIYHAFKHFGHGPITSEDIIDKATGPQEEHLLEILNVFGSCSAWELERMTHQEDPWINARKGLPPDAYCQNVISEDDMKFFYRKLIDGTEAT